jgi:hypothetical protein
MKYYSEQYCEFMQKEALDFATLTRRTMEFAFMGGKLTGDIATALFSLAALGGAGLGYGASKLTSPSKVDVRNKQRAFLANKLKRELSTTNRELAQQDIDKQIATMEPATKPKSIKL